MATKVQTPLEQYLHTSFDGPDREYVDGEVVERNVGDKNHARVQCRLAGVICKRGESRPLIGLAEVRLQLGPRRYRIPDLAIYAGEEPAERIPSKPPLAVIEILSPDDRMTQMLEKLEEYRNWGVTHIWVVSPEQRRLYVHSPAGLAQVAAFEIPEFQVHIDATEIF